MKKISALWLLMVVVLLTLSFSAPQAGAQDSPLVTPHRPTPTGWHNGTPPPAPLLIEQKVKQKDKEASPTVTPTPTVAPRRVMRARVVVQVVERRAWEAWRRHNVD
jgi:hypothetical protein